MEISLDTLHYLFSAIPQTLAAVLAVLIAIVFFRINRIQKILIGEGQAVLNRMHQNVKKDLSYKMIYRLKDAVFRENIAEVKEILKILNDKELDDGISKKTRPRGYQYLYQDRFCNTEQYVNRLKSLSFLVALLTIITIIFSLIILYYSDCLYHSIQRNLIFIFPVILAISSLISTIILIGNSLLRKTVYEDLDLRDKIIENNKNS